MANKQLTATVRLNTTQAEKKLKQISKAIDIMNRSVGRTSNTYNQVNSVLSGTAKATNRAKVNTDKLANSANKVHTNFKKSESTLAKMSRNLRSMLAAYVGVMAIREVLTTSDTITSTENRLNNLKGGNPKLTSESMDKTYAASMRSRSGYSAMLSNVSKTMTLAGNSFDNNIDNAIKFQEIMSKSYTIGGASAAEQASSMYQLVQALGSGVLQGDELRSVREGAPIAYKEIEKFAQGVYNTEESLKELASQGRITSDIVVAAIMDSEEAINTAFNNTKITFDQAGKMIVNMATQAFKPVLQMLNDALRSDIGQAIINGIGKAFVLLANIVLFVGNTLGSFFTWIADNWDWISKLLLSVAVILGVVLLGALILNLITIGGLIKNYILLGIEAVKSAIKSAISWMAMCWPLTLILILLAALLTYVIWVAESFEDALGMIVGGIMTAVAFVWNLFLSLVDLALGVVNVWMDCFTTFINFFANCFNDPIGSIIHLFGDLADSVLGILETIASAIDKLFGSNLADGIAGWRGSLDAKITEAAKKYGNGKYDEKVAAEHLTAESLGLERWAYTDAYNSGYDWGSSAGTWIKDKLFGSSSLFDPYSDEYNLNSSYNTDDLLKNISDDTSDIKDNMDLSNDDLEYMRKIAEMEWRNEFTTAEIRVDMTNNNTVNGERDLDGIVEYLSDVLRTEMSNVAYGVHY